MTGMPSSLQPTTVSLAESELYPTPSQRKAGWLHIVLPLLLLGISISMAYVACSRELSVMPAAAILFLVSSWDLRQWWLRRNRLAIAFEPWHGDDQRMIRLNSIQHYLKAALIPCFLAMLLVFILRRSDHYWSGYMYIYLPMLLQSMVQQYKLQHTPRPPLRIESINWGELKPIESSHWGSPRGSSTFL